MIGGTFATLLRAAQRADADAFDTLWRDLNPVLLRYLRSIVTDPRSDPEALAADTWVDVSRRLTGFHGDETAWRCWVLRRARRRARSDARRLRWADTVRPAASPGSAPTASTADEPGVMASVVPLRARTTLQDVVTSFALDLLAPLPHLDREVLVLRAAGGLPVDDAARVVGRGRQAVRAAGHRASVAVARSPEWGPPAPVAAAELHAAVEHVLAGAAVPEDSPTEVLRLADVTGALAAAPTPAELVGSGPAYAAFYRFVARGGRHRVTRPVVPVFGVRIATGFAVGAVALGGTAAVAYAGALPGPLQEVAHDLFRAPARDSGSPAQHPDHPARGQTPDGGTGGGSDGVAGVIGTGSPSSPAATTAARRSTPPSRSAAPTQGVLAPTTDVPSPTDLPSPSDLPAGSPTDAPGSVTPTDSGTTSSGAPSPSGGTSQSPSPSRGGTHSKTKPPKTPHPAPPARAQAPAGQPAVSP